MSQTYVVSTAVLRDHIAYNQWAIRRLLKACEALMPDQIERDFGTADKSIGGTMLHIHRSERMWLQRILGESQAYRQADDSFSTAVHAWPALHERWRAWISGLSDDQVTAVIEYRDLKDTPRSSVLWHILLHVVNHGTHHRGQVSGFLRALGTTPPPLDYIAWVRERES